MRRLKIAKSLFKEISFRGLIATMRPALFRNDNIVIFVAEVDQLGVSEEGNRGESEIRKGDIIDLDEMEKRLSPVPWELRCHKFDNVKDFFIARNKDGIQCITWIYYQHDHNRFLRLGPGDALLLYSLTFPAFRGQGLYPRVLKAAARFLGERGFKRVFGLVEEHNHASLRGIQKAGFRLVGQIHLRNVFGFQISRRLNTAEI